MLGHLFMAAIVTLAIMVVPIILFEKFKSNKSRQIKTFITIFVVVLIYIIYRSYFSPQIPGHILERYSYSTKWHVNVWADMESSKNYRLPADIASYGNEFYRSHYINKVYWPDGGYMTFDEFYEFCHPSEPPKVGGYASRMKDDSGNEWYIEIPK